MSRYSKGSTKSVRIVEDRIPPITTVARGRCTSAPVPVAMAMGTNPSEATRAVIKTDRKSTRLNSSHQIISYAVFCLKKKKNDAISSTRLGSRNLVELGNSKPRPQPDHPTHNKHHTTPSHTPAPPHQSPHTGYVPHPH